MQICTRIQYYSMSLFLFLVSFFLIALPQTHKAEWLNHGGDLSNTRSRIHGEPTIRRSLLRNLRLRWEFYVGNDVTATPAVSDGVVYFPAWDGNLYAVRALDGGLLWKLNLTQLTGVGGVNGTSQTISRATPVVAGRLLIVGIYGPAVVVAIDRLTGLRVWMTMLDPRPLAQITMSGTVLLDDFYVGVSSSEALLPPEQCCTFRGSFAKLNIATGSILWQTYTVPDNGGRLGGYSGGGVWGSSPSIDPIRRLAYIGTGNLYSAPASVYDCQAKLNNQSSSGAPDHHEPCVGKDVHFDSILAVDLGSGSIKWARRFIEYDVYITTCSGSSSPSCPPPPNLDFDFGEAPMMLTIQSEHGRSRDIVVVVQKSGFVWALDRSTGHLVWFNQAGPGGTGGGGTWGAATDGKTVFTNIANSQAKPFRLAPSNRTTTGGGWVALDASTGAIKWTTAEPNNTTANGPVTLVNDLLFAGSVASSGPFYAMDAATGEILWSCNTGGSLYGGASASYGCLYLGDGISAGIALFNPTWTHGTSVFAFCSTPLH